jgi:nucleoside-diphosphate-sugar epimerase
MGKEHDIRNPFTIEGDFDLVVHNASIVSSTEGLNNPHETYETNIMGTVNTLEYCRKNRTPIIFISSCKVQPDSRGAWGSYGVSKVCGEAIVKDYWKIYGVPYIIVRPASIYGITQDGTSALGWITWFIKAHVHMYEVKVEGNGTQTRDSIHVKDLVDLLTRMVFSFYEGANQIYEAGNGEDGAISVNELIEHLSDKGPELKKSYTSYRRGDPISLNMNPEKAEKV